MPNPDREEDGRFQPGRKGGPGRTKQKDLFAQALHEAGEAPPEMIHYELAARGLGLIYDEDKIPTFDTIRELRCWVIQASAISGDERVQTALMDREIPKPSRTAGSNVAAPIGGRAPSGVLGSSAEAASYLERLAG